MNLVLDRSFLIMYPTFILSLNYSPLQAYLVHHLNDPFSKDVLWQIQIKVCTMVLRKKMKTWKDNNANDNTDTRQIFRSSLDPLSLVSYFLTFPINLLQSISIVPEIIFCVDASVIQHGILSSSDNFVPNYHLVKLLKIIRKKIIHTHKKMYFNSHHNDINVSSLNGQDVEWKEKYWK